MLIKREMPVPDAASGASRWSVDFFFVDQSAMPTFVECKRFNDTRSRREVVGQVLEYAANGPYLWNKDIIRKHAEASAKKRGRTLEQALRTLVEPEGTDSPEEFFNRVEENLKKSQIRIVFFLEEAPNELKCLVEFLNEQMLSSEILLVEARQYKYMQTGIKVIVPTLFGFTEQARRVKQTVTVSSRKTQKWDWDSFKADAQARGLDKTAVETVLHELLKSQADLGCEIAWGGGGLNGSFGLRWSDICSSSAVLVWSNGALQIAFGALNTSETAENFRDELAHLITAELGLPVPEDYKKRWVSYPISDWGKNVGLLLKLLKNIASSFNFRG
jgi:hypothetical protein